MLNAYSNHGEENRHFDRTELTLRTVVQIRESSGETFKEVATVTSISMNGAQFELSRQCVVGRLVLLALPMPVELRLYDEQEKIYPVVAIVQSCFASKRVGQSGYCVSVAFTGKRIPESYLEDPAQNYRISGILKNGTWKIVESDSAFMPRKHQRVWKQLEVAITLVQKERNPALKIKAFTREVSAGGMSVLCSVDAAIGDKMKIACPEYQFFSLAVVRNFEELGEDKKRLHLEFVDSTFPMSKLSQSRTTGASGTDLMDED